MATSSVAISSTRRGWRGHFTVLSRAANSRIPNSTRERDLTASRRPATIRDRENIAMLDLGLSGKVAIVTGGSEGLGRATALRLAAEGAHVVICARRKDVLERAAEMIRTETGVQVLAHPADVTRPGDVESVVNATLATHRG